MTSYDKITALAGWLALALLTLLGVGTILAVLAKGGVSNALPNGALPALRFTLLQAGLSASISVFLGVPLARALARRHFLGRGLLIALLAAPILLPGLVAVLGLLAVFGRSGPISAIFQAMGFSPMSIYGLTGILLAHVFFNLPLVTRLILQGWSDIPREQFRLAAQLGMKSLFWHLELPMLRRVLPGALLLVFLLSSTSFAVVLTIGGGPAATTLELAIYQALRFDFDLSGAAQLAMMQLALCALAAFLVGRFRSNESFGQTRALDVDRWDGQDRLTLSGDIMGITLAALFLLVPIAAVLIRGIPALLNGLSSSVWGASARSLMVAISSSILTLTFSLALAQLIDSGRARRLSWARSVESAGYLTLAVSPFVMGTGLFILIYPIADPFALALPVTAIVNAGLCVPFGLRLLIPAFAKARTRYARLADALNLQGWARFRIAFWPEVRRPAMFSAALAAALSMGDLGVVALFAPPEGGTLPLVMQRLMAAYQMDAAAGAAVLLIGLAFGLFWLIDRGGRVDN